MENEETLKASTLICQFANPVQDQVHNFFANGVMTSGIVVGCVLLASHQLLRVEQLSIGAGPHLSLVKWELMLCSDWSIRTEFCVLIGQLTSSMTVGSRSTNTALGTCLPAPVSEKKVLKLSSPPPMVLSEGIWPSGWMPTNQFNWKYECFPI